MQNNYSKILSLVLTGLCLTICNQLPAQEFDFKHIDYSYGMSNSQVPVIKQDEAGFIWIGTQGGGAYKWDGQALHPLADKLKYDLIIDLIPLGPKEHLLLSYNRLVHYKNGKITELPYNKYTEGSDDMVRRIYELDDAILLLSSKGRFSIISKSDFSIITSSLYASDQKFSPKASVEGDTVTLFTSSQTLKLNYVNSAIDTISIYNSEQKFKPYQLSESGNSYLVLKYDSLIKYDKQLNKKGYLTHDLKVNIYQAAFFKGYYWLMGESGLFQCKAEGNTLNLVKKHLSYPIMSFYISGDFMWLGTMKGLFQIQEEDIHLLQADNDNYNSGYFDFHQVGEEVWGASVNDGIHIFEGGELKQKIKSKYPSYNNCRSFVELGDDSIMAASNGGLMKIHKINKGFTYYELYEKPILSIQTSDGNIYIGSSRDGLFKWDANHMVKVPFTGELSSNSIYSVVAIGDKLFVGTEAGFNIIENGSVYQPKALALLNSTPITSIVHVNDSVLALGYAPGGVILYNVLTNTILHEYHDRNGLSSNYTYVLKLIDDQLWVGSSLGIDVIDLNETDEISQLRKFNKIAGAETFYNSMIALDDEVWVNTIAGTVVVPRNIVDKYHDQKYYPIQIEGVEPLTFNDTTVINLDKESIEIPYQHNSLRINFNVAEYNNKHAALRYQLIGYDNHTNDANENKYAVYKQLPSGNYTFKVWHENDEASAATIDFVITVPFYLNKLYQAIFVGIALTIIFFGIWYTGKLKVKKQAEEQRIKEEAQDALRKDMAIDFHDELGNHLAKIINFSGVAQMQALSETQEAAVKKIEKSANELFVSTKDLIWSLKKENNNLEELFFYIKDFAERLFDHSAINLRCYKDANFSHLTFNPKASRDLSLIMKEAFTNIYKHAEAKNITVELNECKGAKACFSIKEDGVGFNQDEVLKKNGLKNMAQRASRSGFILDITSKVGEGSTILITIK